MTTPAGQVQLVLTTRERIARRATRKLRLEHELDQVWAEEAEDRRECVDTIACHYPGCLAGPGEPCMTVSGRVRREVHPDRWQRYVWRDG